MHGLQVTESELSFLNGAIVSQVCVGQNEMILRFDNDVTITVTSEVICFYSTETSVRFSDFSRGASVVCSLLGQAVLGLTISDAGRQLLLDFGDTSFVLIDDCEEFESFTIAFGGKTYVA